MVSNLSPVFSDNNQSQFYSQKIGVILDYQLAYENHWKNDYIPH